MLVRWAGWRVIIIRRWFLLLARGLGHGVDKMAVKSVELLPISMDRCRGKGGS